jgi:hypothetical protein
MEAIADFVHKMGNFWGSQVIIVVVGFYEKNLDVFFQRLLPLRF